MNPLAVFLFVLVVAVATTWYGRAVLVPLLAAGLLNEATMLAAARRSRRA